MKKLLCSLFVIASCNSFASVGDVNAQVNGSVGASLYDFYSSVRSNIDTELRTSNDSVTMVGFTNNSGYLTGNNLSNANALFITFKDSRSSQVLWTKTLENEFFDKPQVSFVRNNFGYNGAYLTPTAIKSINYSKAYKTVSDFVKQKELNVALNKLVMVIIFNDADMMAGEHKRNIVSYVFQEKKSSENCTVIDYAVDGDFAKIMKSKISCSEYKNIL